MSVCARAYGVRKAFLVEDVVEAYYELIVF